MELGIYWCDACNHPIKTTKQSICPTCGIKIRYLTTDVRPVFARERRILQFYNHGPLTTDRVWRSSKSRYYYITSMVSQSLCLSQPSLKTTCQPSLNISVVVITTIHSINN